jgi:phenylpyruvate tautomerase PptA (4-oxalocrotonate tautomerase family)
MPTYTCTTTAGRLSEEQRLKVVESITAMHSEETGAPRYLVQVIFYEVDAHAHYIGGKKAPEEQIWIRGDIRSGRTEAVKRNMLGRIVRDVAAYWLISFDCHSNEVRRDRRLVLHPARNRQIFRAQEFRVEEF